ncbi:MAG: VWA domain-containing protein [Phycisphaerae bacterium]|nr:VWA domain-containing protein [Phycisphaerae bacterium]
MTFTTPSVSLIAAGIALPSLLLLYFLKLRRQQHVVPSTMLWKKAVQDLQVNTPFQKLRRNLLLLLQLLILAALLFALAGPTANFQQVRGRNFVILIDRSGSMKTIESDGRTRIEHAKDAAADFVTAMRTGTRAMVIAFADRAEVICTFTVDARQLQSRIRDIEAVDASSRIGEALQLAMAYSTRTGDQTDSMMHEPGISSDESVRIELFSDGRLADIDKEILTQGELNFHRIGEAADNTGIVAFDLRHELDRPGVAIAFARVENFGPSEITTDVSFLVDGKLLKVQELTLGPADAASADLAASGTAASAGAGLLASGPARMEKEPRFASAQNLMFELENTSAALIELRINRPDALDIDNSVVAPVETPRGLRVLSVSDRPEVQYYMRRAFQLALEIPDFRAISTARYESGPDSEFTVDGRSAYDLVILDDHDTNRLAPGNYMFFGGIPQIEGVRRENEVVDEQIFVNWRESHPLLQHASFENIVVLGWEKLSLPDYAIRLVEGENSTALAYLTDPGHRYVIAAFDLMESNCFEQPAMIIFLQNALSFLAAGRAGEQGRLVQPGESMTLNVPAGASRAIVRLPDSERIELDASNRPAITFARTGKHGLYSAAFDDPSSTTEKFAVNLLDPNESRIAPAQSLEFGSGRIAAIDQDSLAVRPLWPYAAIAALAIVMFEWWVYNRRVMI